jgi:hypothetical protein
VIAKLELNQEELTVLHEVCERMLGEGFNPEAVKAIRALPQWANLSAKVDEALEAISEPA